MRRIRARLAPFGKAVVAAVGPRQAVASTEDVDSASFAVVSSQDDGVRPLVSWDRLPCAGDSRDESRPPDGLALVGIDGHDDAAL